MKKILALAIVLLSCNGEEPPPPPPPPAEICPLWVAGPAGCVCPEGSEIAPALDGVCAPPRVDQAVQLRQLRGVTGFSLAMRETEFVSRATYYIHENGWNTWRVGAQTAHDWCGPNTSEYLPCGPPHGSAGADANLIRMLDVTARIPHTWIQLIPTFTYKSHNTGSQAGNVEYFNAMFDHVNAIVEAGGYKHVFYELFNEVEHPLSQHIKDEDVREMFLHARAKTSLPIGTDYDGQGSGENWKGRYPYIWRDVSTYIAFHTPRNPEPSLATMQAAQDKYNYYKPVFVDETVCWASDEAISTYGLQNRGTIAMKGFGTENSRMRQVVDHLRNIHRLGWRPLYHSIWGISCFEMGRIPNYDNDIAPSGDAAQFITIVRAEKDIAWIRANIDIWAGVHDPNYVIGNCKWALNGNPFEMSEDEMREFAHCYHAHVLAADDMVRELRSPHPRFPGRTGVTKEAFSEFQNKLNRLNAVAEGLRAATDGWPGKGTHYDSIKGFCQYCNERSISCL